MKKSSIDKRVILISSRKTREKTNIVLPLIRAALKDSKVDYTLLTLQYLVMALILIVETKFYSRDKKCITYITYRSNTDF